MEEHSISNFDGKGPENLWILKRNSVAQVMFNIYYGFQSKKLLLYDWLVW